MRYTFEDFDTNRHRALDAWRSDAIARFAMDGSISREWQYYLDAAEYRAGVDAFCKVALLNGSPVAVMIMFCNPDYPVGINPIIVDPALAGQGLGSEILQEFTAHIDDILPFRSDRIEVVIDLENAASIRAFARAGFNMARMHPDGDAVIYERLL